MAQENLGILIKLRQEGMQLLDQLIDGMEKAGVEAGEFRQRADALNADLRKLAEQQQLINQFRAQKDAVSLASAAYEQAQVRAQQLARELQESNEPTKRQAAEFDRTREAVRVAGAAYDQARQQLQDLRQSLSDVGVNTNELAAANVRVKAGMDQAHAAVAKLTQEVRQAGDVQRAFGTLGVRSAKDVETEIAKVRAAMQTLQGATGLAGSALAQSMQAGETRIKALERELRGLNGQLTLTDRVANAMGGTLGQIFGGNLLANGVTMLVGKVADLAREFIASNIEAQRLAKSLDAIYKNSGTTSAQIAFLRKTANEAGMEFRGLTDQFVSFSAATKSANIPLEVSNELFASITKAGATLGLSTERVGNALLALSQMASKGTVAMEELRGQLGEALPGALGLAAKGLGITDQQLIKLVESGGLAARDLLPALAQALKEMEGDTDTAAGGWARLKNAVTQALQGMGEGGGIDVMTNAVKALAAVVGVLVVPLHAFAETLFLVGRAAGAAGAAVAIMTDGSMTWREKLAAAKDIVQDLSDKTAEAGARISSTAEAFMRAAGATDQQAQSTSKAAQAASDFSRQMVSLGVASAEAAKQQEQLIKNSDKLAAASKSEGDALVQVAKLRGDAKALAEAEAQSADMSAAAAGRSAAARRELLQTLQGELDAKLKLLSGNPAEMQAREAEITALRTKIAAVQAEAQASAQAAASAGMEAAQRATAAKAYDDNSAAVDKLRTAMQEAQLALEAVIEKEKTGVASKADVTAASVRAAQATALYRDALKDSVDLNDANSRMQDANLSMGQAVLRLDLERAKTEERRARAAGDEYRVREAQIRQKEIELNLAVLQIQADNARADASIAAAKAKQADLEASGQMTQAQRKAIEASITAAEAQKKVNEAKEESLNALRDEIEEIKRGGNEKKSAQESGPALKERRSILADRPAQQGGGVLQLPDFSAKEQDHTRAMAPSGAAPDVPQAAVQQQWQSAWDNKPAPAAAGAAERTVRVNLNLGGQALGDVQTDEAGAAAIERLLRTLEDGMRQSGGRRF